MDKQDRVTISILRERKAELDAFFKHNDDFDDILKKLIRCYRAYCKEYKEELRELDLSKPSVPTRDE